MNLPLKPNSEDIKVKYNNLEVKIWAVSKAGRNPLRIQLKWQATREKPSGKEIAWVCSNIL